MFAFRPEKNMAESARFKKTMNLFNSMPTRLSLKKRLSELYIRAF